MADTVSMVLVTFYFFDSQPFKGEEYLSRALKKHWEDEGRLETVSWDIEEIVPAVSEEATNAG